MFYDTIIYTLCWCDDVMARFAHSDHRTKNGEKRRNPTLEYPEKVDQSGEKTENNYPFALRF